ncbi:MAG TPA: hypothetical protein VKA74_15925, partial [Myxococcota bacterium]|nr:hypothetical protein [Myxococcota bacterium]
MTRTGAEEGDAAGSWSDDGFAAGDLIRIADSDANDGLYRILSLDSETVIAVERLDSTAALVQGDEQTDVRVEGTIAAVSSSVQEPLGVDGDAWTRSAGSFLDEGFEAGQLLVVEGAGSRDGTYRIASVETGRLALTGLDGGPVDLGTASDLPGALLSRSFRLTDLNAGARGLGFGSAPGASEQAASLHDLLVTTSDGSEFLVSLDGAETVGDVLSRIEAAAVESGAAPDRIRARIAEDGTGIELVERGQLSGSPRLAFEASGSRLVRSEGDWADDGFAIGDEIVVSGTARNDGTHRIIDLEKEDPSDPEAGRTVLVLEGALVDEDFVRDAEIVRLGFERGPEDFRVDRINGSNAALGLGILRPDAETDRNEDGEIDVLDADGLIEGSAIGGSSLFDRIFIEDPELRASLFLEPSLPGGIDITGDFGFFEAALNADGRLFAEASIRLDDPGEGDAEDGRITLREIATGIQDIRSFVDGPRFAGNALDADAGSILFANDAEGGVITRQAGDWEADDFRVGQRITLRNAGGRDGDYTVRAIEAAAGQTERRILRLEETLPPGTSPDPIPADGALEVVAAIGTLRFEVVQAALGDFADFAALGPDAAVVLTLYDFGDPFFREVVGPQSKAGGSVSFEASDRIRVTRGSGSEEVDETLADLREALAAREELRLEITYTDAGGEERTASGEIVSIDAEGRIRVEEDLVETVDGLDVSEVRFTKPPRTDIDTPDLGNLLDFQDIGLRDVIRGLQLASDFLGQFEAFGFLDDPIPVIGTSFNDLLAYADELARVVEDLSRDPDGSLQRLEARLEEILGIDDGTDPALGQDPFDVELTLATEELFGASTGETKSVLRLDLVVGSEWRESLGVDFDLGGEGVLAGSAGLATRAAAEIRVALGLDISQTRMRGDPALVFRARAGEENDEIERLDGESFLGDGFLPGQTIRIEGTSANDGRYEILGIGAEGRTLILAEDLAASEGEEGIGLSGVELTGSRAVSLFDDTAITASFEAGAENVSFRAAVGPLGLFVNDGRIGIGGSLAADPNAPADEPLDVFRAGLDFAQPTSDGEAPIFASGTAGAADAPYRRQLAETVLNDLGDTFSAELAGGVDVSLPVFFPNDSIERGAVALQVGLALDDENGLTTTGSGVQFFEVGQPDPVAFSELFDLSGLLDLGQLSLFDNVLLAVDGFDLFLGGLQDVLDGEVFGIELPLIGDGLADGARFIEDLREDFVEPFRAAVEDAETFVDDQEDPDRNILSKLLFDLLAPTGLLLVTRDADGNALADADIFTARVENLVTDPGAALAAGQFFLRQVIDLDGTRRDAAGRFFEEDGSVVTEGEIDLAGIPTENLEELAFLEWDFRLGQSLAAVDTDIALDFGLPGLGLEADGAIGLELGWDLELGFGLDFSNGFYFDIGSASELEVDIDVVLPDRLAGRLAFLQLDAINAGSGLGASFAVDVVNRDDPGDDQLSFGELGKLRLETGLAAEARA